MTSDARIASAHERMDRLEALLDELLAGIRPAPAEPLLTLVPDDDARSGDDA